MALGSALRLLHALSRERVPPCHVSLDRLEARGAGPVQVYRYEPSSPPVRGHVLVAHGLSPRGPRDPQVVRVACALAAAGYTAWVPRLPELAQLKLSATTADRLAGLVEALAERTGQPLALLSTSWTAGLCLQVASRESVGHRVSGICAVDAVTELAPWLDWLLADQASDPLGRILVLRNLLPRVRVLPAAVAEALEVGARDLLQARAEPALPRFLEAASPECRDLVRALAGDLAVRRDLVGPLLEASADLSRALDHGPALSRLETPVLLLQGGALPAGHLQRLHDRLAGAGVPVRTEEGSLVGPADLATRIALFRGLRWWITRLRRPQRQRLSDVAGQYEAPVGVVQASL